MRRSLPALEFCLAALLVLGHNVWRVVPNEVPLLCLAAIVSLRLRTGRFDFGALGFHRPDSWLRLVAIALLAATLRILLSDFVVEPWAESVWGAPELPSGANEITGNIGYALLALVFVWGFAGFGEEIAYRGYALNRGAAALGGAPAAFWLAAIASSVLFGYGHYYKGPGGVIDSGMAGLILAAAYLATGRNLWTCVMAHGFIDTFGVVWVYLGLPD
jgi:membrane protease YdiL (CAAX protease family)